MKVGRGGGINVGGGGLGMTSPSITFDSFPLSKALIAPAKLYSCVLILNY